jgi:outer membrane biosynthesis protein TonB
MTEGVFILTALFVAYVIYVIVNEKKAGGDKITKPSAAVSQPAQQVSVSEKPKVEVAKPKPVAVAKKASAKPAAKPVEAKKTEVVEKAVEAKKTVAVKKAAVAPAPKPAPAPAPAAESTAIKGAGLKDPKTGEVATSYSNYRFTKRWIKEALVAEKLVDKVYKNDELNASVEAKIKEGIIKLEGMKKYKA